MSQDLANSGYAASDVLTQLHKSGNVMRFRYEWLDNANTSKGWLDDVEGKVSTISYDSSQLIKRTGKFAILDPEDQGFNFINDRIRPWIGMQMPDGGWVDWPQGIFVLSSPTRSKSGGLISRSVDGYDLTQNLIDDVAQNAFVGHAGTYLTDVIGVLLGSFNNNIIASDTFFHFDRIWPAGTTKAQIIADMIVMLNYRPLWFDGYGTAQVTPIVLAQDKTPFIAYNTDSDSIIQQSVSQTLDLFAVPNVIINVVSQPGMAVFQSKFVNSDPNSPISTINRGRYVVKFDDTLTFTAKTDLDAYTRQQAIAAANVYDVVQMNTMIVPVHEDHDVVSIRHDSLGISNNFEEVAWSIQMKAGGAMSHTFRHVVNIDSSLIGDPNQYTGT